MSHRRFTVVTATILCIVSVLLVLGQLGPLFATNQTEYNFQIAFKQLKFDHPVGICVSGEETNKFFVIEQKGTIYYFNNQENVEKANVFLDIHERVHLGAFLGLSFHPNFAKNGLFYTYYLADNPLRTIISQWSVMKDNAYQADNGSEKVVLEISQSSDAHSGGQLAFGPDGYLYIAVGDGEPYGDLSGNAQNCSSLKGKILRIDINHRSEGREYDIPLDNPFAKNIVGYRQEIFAWGFRNPWRFSFDSKTGLLWAGDVGQDRMEEIDIVFKGKNYGWNIMEGTLLHNASFGYNTSELELPVWEYGRDLGNATIGGFIYQGKELPKLSGQYIFGDYVSGRVWSLNRIGNETLIKELFKTNLNITSFGIDEKNELYFCSQDGSIYKIILK